jgi:ribosome-binding protein aMBF1 (putative translation factor)
MSMDIQALFGSRIRSIREGANFSREVVAEKADINANYLGEIERGEKWPSLDGDPSSGRSTTSFAVRISRIRKRRT